MVYTKQTWADGSAGGTPLSADRLNHMEQGISDGNGGMPYNRTAVSVDVPPFAASMAAILYTSYTGSPVVYGNSPAIGAYLTYIGDICPGTWTARFWFIRLTNVGIVNIDYSFDNATWNSLAANLDQYAAAASSGFVDKVGIVVPAGIYTVYIRGTIVGKNPSSTNSLLMMGTTSFVRTA